MSTQLELTDLLQSIAHALSAFNVEGGSAFIEQVVATVHDDPNNIQLLATLKQELARLPSLTNLNMHGEMLWFIQKAIEGVQAADVINKKLITRTIENLYRGLEPFARNDAQRTALKNMQIAKEDALGIETRHRMSNKQFHSILDDDQPCQNDGKELHMTRELKSSNY